MSSLGARRRINIPKSDASSSQTVPSHRNGTRRDDTPLHLLNALLWLAPLSILCVLALVLFYASTMPLPHAKRHAEDLAGKAQGEVYAAPTLPDLIADVADALELNGVLFWLMPATGLLPPDNDTAREIGQLATWREGVDFGVDQAHMLQIIMAQTSLQAHGIVAVESYFGLRLFPLSGYHDDRYDYHVPFVDLVYFQMKPTHVASFCCDCAPIAFSACTKKTCSCLVCAYHNHWLFPLDHVRIKHVRRPLPAPRESESLLVPRDLPRVHPALFDTLVDYRAPHKS